MLIISLWRQLGCCRIARHSLMYMGEIIWYTLLEWMSLAGLTLFPSTQEYHTCILRKAAGSDTD